MSQEAIEGVVNHRGKPRLVSVDGLKGVAIVFVVGIHYMEILTPGIASTIYSQISYGRLGTLLFFIVTGFLIPGSLRKDGFAIITFFTKRAVRLWPGLWISLLVGYFASLNTGNAVPVLTLGNCVANMIGIQTWFRYPNFNPVTWTLGIDWLIYLKFASIRKFSPKTDYSLLAVVAGFFIGVVTPSMLGQRVPAGALTLYLGSAVGWVWFQYLKTKSLTKGGAFARISGLSLIECASILVNNSNERGYEFYTYHTPKAEIFAWILACTLFLIATAKDFYFGRILSYLGRASYSIYLFHGIGILGSETGGNERVCLIFVAALLSIAVYHFVEKPIISAGLVRSAKPETAR